MERKSNGKMRRMTIPEVRTAGLEASVSIIKSVSKNVVFWVLGCQIRWFRPQQM